MREQLKSKIHRACVTDANVNYEGSISIPVDLLEQVDLWEGEKVLVVSATNGARLETYVQPGSRGSGAIIMNGGAAHLIQQGHRISILAFAGASERIGAKKILCNERNEVVSCPTQGTPACQSTSRATN